MSEGVGYTCMQCLYIELFGLLPQRLSNQIRFTKICTVMNYRNFKEMFGKDAELFHVALSKNKRFFIEIEGETVSVFDANLSSKFLGQPEAERAIMKYFADGNAHAWEALDKETNETYWLISDGSGDHGVAFRWDEF